MLPVSSPASPSEEADVSDNASPPEANSAVSPAPKRAPLRNSFRHSSLRDSRWRPLLSCAGALGVGLSLAPALLKPASAPVDEGGAVIPQIALLREDTFVMTPATPPGAALLRGRIRLVAGETDMLGRARAGGQVARHLVESGARVRRGQPIVEISSGEARRRAPVSEGRQDRAEQGQIAAADAQNALAQKISIAQVRLRSAQERVTRSQAQVGVARDIVRRLQNGQSVAPGEIPGSFRAASPPEIPPYRIRKKSRRAAAKPDPAAQIAARQAEAARDAAKQSERVLQSSRDMLANAKSTARVADEKAENAAKAVVEVEARFDDKKATGADVEAARAAQKDAQSAVDAAEKGLNFATTELGKREKNAASAQRDAQSSADQAARSLASAKLESAAESVDEEDVSIEAPAREAAPRVTLESAVRFASEALDESRRASRQAERIATEIDGYQNQATRSKSRVEAATQDLAQAQQRVMESVPRPRFTTSYAPSGGIVTWISRLAREVGEGDPVFGIARGQRVAARFEDRSGLWRAIKPGATLTAFVVDAPAESNTQPSGGTSNAALGAAPGAALDATQKLGVGHAVQLKMTEIEAPKTGGEAAKLSGALVAGQGAGDLAEGAAVLISMPRPNQKATLSVPISALVRRGATTYVGVLAPLSTGEIQAQLNAQKPEKNAAQTPEPSDSGAGETFRLRWTRVETGRSDGLRLEILAGLRAGARVLSEPEDLEAMGLAPAPQTQSTVLDKKNATPNSNLASDAPPDANSLRTDETVADSSAVDVLVRLTPALA